MLLEGGRKEGQAEKHIVNGRLQPSRLPVLPRYTEPEGSCRREAG